MSDASNEEEIWFNDFYLYFKIVCRLCGAEASYEDCWDEFKTGAGEQAATAYARRARVKAKMDGWVFSQHPYQSNFICCACEKVRQA